MLSFKRRTAVRPEPRNILGKRMRRRLTLREVIAMELSGLDRGEFLDLLDRGYAMPAMGGTTAQNQTLASPIYFPKAVVVSTDQTINQGDMVYWDDVHYTLKPLTAVSQVAYTAGAGTGGFAGCAAGSNNPGVYPAVPGGVPSENLPGIMVQRGGTVGLGSTTGDGTYFPFEPVTVGADAQTVTRGGETSTNKVGVVVVPLPVAARGTPGATPAPETVPGGSRVEVWIAPQWPAYPSGGVLL